MSALPISPSALAKGLATGTYKHTEAGIEKRCTCCGELWPVDDEFYKKQKQRDGYRASAMCRACFKEKYGLGIVPAKGAK